MEVEKEEGSRKKVDEEGKRKEGSGQGKSE